MNSPLSFPKLIIHSITLQDIIIKVKIRAFLSSYYKLKHEFTVLQVTESKLQPRDCKDLTFTDFRVKETEQYSTYLFFCVCL